LGELAKILIWTGSLLLALGFIVWLAGKIPGIGHLPGDILIKKERFTFYFPLATSLLFSLIISLILYFLNRR